MIQILFILLISAVLISLTSKIGYSWGFPITCLWEPPNFEKNNNTINSGCGTTNTSIVGIYGNGISGIFPDKITTNISSTHQILRNTTMPQTCNTTNNCSVVMWYCAEQNRPDNYLIEWRKVGVGQYFFTTNLDNESATYNLCGSATNFFIQNGSCRLVGWQLDLGNQQGYLWDENGLNSTVTCSSTNGNPDDLSIGSTSRVGGDSMRDVIGSFGRIAVIYGKALNLSMMLNFNYTLAGGFASDIPTYSNNITNVTNVSILTTFMANVTWSDSGGGGLNDCISSIDNGSGVFINQTPLNLPSSGICSFNHTVNSTRHKLIRWRFYGNDTDKNMNETLIMSFNISNTFPIFNITTNIVPSPSVSTNNLTCNFLGADADSDTIINETAWYLNYSEQVSLRNITTVGSGNLSSNQNWTCSARVYDSYNYSNWTNSTILTIGDSTIPVFKIGTISSSYLTTEIVTISTNCTDTDSTIDFVRFRFTSETDNRTMTLFNSSSGEYRFNSTLGAGTYNASRFYCRDSSNNMNQTDTSLTFTVTAPAEGTSGGGGGGGVVIISPIKANCSILVVPKSPIPFNYNDKVIAVYITNLDNKSIGFSYSVNDTNILDFRTVSPQIIAPQQSAEISLIKKVSEINETMYNTLSLKSNECKDLNIPIKLETKEVTLTPIGNLKAELFRSFGTINILGSAVNVFFWHFIVLMGILSSIITYFIVGLNFIGKVVRTLLLTATFTIIIRLVIGLIIKV